MTRLGLIAGFSVATYIGFCAPALAASAALAVQVENHSVATKCAEEDNVYYTFQAPAGQTGSAAPAIGGFRVEATGVPYLPVLKDSTAPDFTDCSFGQDWAPDAHPYTPPTATLYEDDQYILKGIVYPNGLPPAA